MKKYYLHDGNEQLGPFAIDELKDKKINAETHIWCEGMTDWIAAGKIEELKDILIVVPPKFEKTQSTPPPIVKDTIKEASTKPKKKKQPLLISILLIVGILGGIGAISLFKNIDSNDASTYEEQKMTVEEIEKSQPANFLEASGNYNENFWGDKLKIHGEVTNKATVANYKDVVIHVIYYSETETELGSEDYTIFDIFPLTLLNSLN
jgi:hypothetical protein